MGVRLGAASIVACAALSCDVPGLAEPLPVESDETFAIVEGWPSEAAVSSFGRVLGVAVAPDGRVWVSHTADGAARNDEPIRGATLAVLDPDTGDVLDELGRGQFALPHALAFDADGRLWVTDADANQIVVLDRSGLVLARIGADR